VFKAIFWDNDGVLVETEPLYFRATQQVLASIGVPLTEQQYIDWFLVDGRGAWHLAEERGLDVAAIDRLKAARNALYARWLSDAPPPVVGIADVLARLRRQYVMAVVTSCRREHFDLIHRASGLLEYFDFVLTPGDYARTKPAPDPYARAVERSGVAPEACIAIEDSERGLTSATRAGIRCIVVPSGFTRGGRFAGAHRVLSSVNDIPAALWAARP
jgi:HAD superfamily hydrolase (TIGR01509 family)